MGGAGGVDLDATAAVDLRCQSVGDGLARAEVDRRRGRGVAASPGITRRWPAVDGATTVRLYAIATAPSGTTGSVALRPATDIRRVSPARMGSPPVRVSRIRTGSAGTKDGGAGGDVDRDGRCAGPTALTARSLTRWEMPLCMPVIRSGLARELGERVVHDAAVIDGELIVQDRRPAVSGRWEEGHRCLLVARRGDQPGRRGGSGGGRHRNGVAHQAWSVAGEGPQPNSVGGAVTQAADHQRAGSGGRVRAVQVAPSSME